MLEPLIELVGASQITEAFIGARPVQIRQREEPPEGAHPVDRPQRSPILDAREQLDGFGVAAKLLGDQPHHIVAARSLALGPSLL